MMTKDSPDRQDPALPDRQDGHSPDPFVPDPEPTPDAIQSVHVAGVTYELRKINCGKATCLQCNGSGHRRATHGPYWYARWTEARRTHRVYMGKNLDTLRYRDAAGRMSIASVRAARAGNSPGDPPAAAGIPAPSADDSSTPCMANGHTNTPQNTSRDRQVEALARRRRLEALEAESRSHGLSLFGRLREWWTAPTMPDAPP